MLLIQEDKRMQLLLNVGGPDRVSRVQMAEAVAQFRGHDSSLIKPVSASSVIISFKSCGKNSYSCSLNLIVCYSLIPKSWPSESSFLQGYLTLERFSNDLYSIAYTNMVPTFFIFL